MYHVSTDQNNFYVMLSVSCTSESIKNSLMYYYILCVNMYLQTVHQNETLINK